MGKKRTDFKELDYEEIHSGEMMRYYDIAQYVRKLPAQVYLDDCCCVNFERGTIRLGKNGKEQPLGERRCKLLQVLVACRNKGLSIETLERYFQEPSLNETVIKDFNVTNLISRLRTDYCAKCCGDKMKCIQTKKKPDKTGSVYLFVPTERFQLVREAEVEPAYIYDLELPEARCEQFEPCGRYQDSEELQHLLDRAFVWQSRVHVICGEPGMGKSELARAYAIACNDVPVRADESEDIKFVTIFRVPYQTDGLRKSIASVPITVPIPEGADPYAKRLELFTKAAKPSLLILDNCNEPLAEDFGPGSVVFRELLETGCHILITTRQDLGRRFSFPQTLLRPMGTENLIYLFSRISGRSWRQDDTQLRFLIEVLLHQNTHLVCLAAELAQTRAVSEIIEMLQNLRVRNLQEVIDTEKDRAEEHCLSFAEHCRRLFEPESLGRMPIEKKVLLNLMLTPMSGISQTSFLQDAFSPEEQEDALRVLLELRRENRILLREQRLVFPCILRGLLLEQFAPLDLSLAERYVATIGKQMHAEVYHDRMEEYLELAANCRLLLELGPVTVPYALLMSDLASNYEMLKRPEEAYQFAKIAIGLLDRLPNGERSRQEETDIAVAYNNVGYSLRQNRDHADAAALTEHALNRAAEMVSHLLKTATEDAVRLARIQAKVEGNTGAYLNAHKRHTEALEIHLKGVESRKELLRQYPTEEVGLLLAAAYASVASDYYHCAEKRASKMEKLADLMESCSYHEKAVGLYEDYLTWRHYNTVVACNRFAGSFAAAFDMWLRMNDAEQKEVPERLVPTSVELSDLQEKVCRGAVYLSGEMEHRDELEECVVNAKRLLELADRADALDDRILELSWEAYDAAQEYCDQAGSNRLSMKLKQFDRVLKEAEGW